MSYGIPYRGSKNTIAKRIIDLLPRADTFVDLFAGGCAMTHCAMGSGKYHNFIANDIGDAPQLFANAIAGKYRDERRWISREDFFLRMGTPANCPAIHQRVPDARRLCVRGNYSQSIGSIRARCKDNRGEVVCTTPSIHCQHNTPPALSFLARI